MNATLALPIIDVVTDVCRHCGDPCGERPVRSAGAVFCCAGCASVFTLLQDKGLDAFYACDLTPGVSHRQTGEREPSRFAALDDPTVAARFVEFDDGTLAGVTFSVPELHCASCLWLLERLWRVDSGIVRADADLLRRTVHVWFRPARISLRGVAERLAAVGYEPLLTDESRPEGMPPARRSLYLKLAVAGFAFGNIMLFSIPRYANGGPLEGGFQRLFDALNVALALPVLLYSASGYFTSAWRAIATRRVILDVPVALGLAVLFGRSLFDIVTTRSEGFMDSFTGLVFFLLIGRLLQQKAFDRIAFDRSFRSFLPLSMSRASAGTISCGRTAIRSPTRRLLSAIAHLRSAAGGHASRRRARSGAQRLAHGWRPRARSSAAAGTRGGCVGKADAVSSVQPRRGSRSPAGS